MRQDDIRQVEIGKPSRRKTISGSSRAPDANRNGARCRCRPTGYIDLNRRNGLRLMPKIERWENLPERVRQHPIDRMRDRAISLSDFNQLRLWIETRPHVPEVSRTRISALSRSAVADHI